MNYLDIVNDFNDQLRVFGYGFIAWSAVFGMFYDRVKIRTIPQHKQLDIFNRIISIAHGQMTLWGSIYIIMYQKTQGFQEENNATINMLLLASSAYMAYDILVCVFFDLYDNWLIFHHLISLLTFIQSILMKQGGYFIIYGFVFTQISNFPMHLRYIIRQCGGHLTKTYECIEIIYFILFILFRGILSPIFLAKAWKDVNTPFLIKLGGSGILVYSLYYIFEMTKICQRKIKYYKERCRKNFTMYWFTVNPELTKLKQYQEIIDPIL